jgi:hypothetical protein
MANGKAFLGEKPIDSILKQAGCPRSSGPARDFTSEQINNENPGSIKAARP